MATLRLSGPRPADLSLTLAHDDCKACHESPHGDQFDRRPDGDACESCHGADAFRPASRFDHNRDAAFPLKGAHARVACEKCHVPKPGPDGKPFVTYRPLSSKCESCHGDKPLSPLEISRAGDPAGPVSRVRPGVVRPGGGA